MKALTGLIWVFLFLAVAAWMNRDRMPSQAEILPQLYEAPLQGETLVLPFSFDHKGKYYTVTPKFSYDLRGLVVSCHGAKEAFDYYHERWGDDLNVNDLCVIWGDNIKNEVWRSLRFKSGSWMCYIEYLPGRSGSARDLYRDECLSNNHLLSRDPAVIRRLLGIRRGDQIRIEGWLAEYKHSDGRFRRGTSTSRYDTGNGACETIYVKNVQVLKRANPFWRAVFPLAVAGFFVSVAAAIWSKT